MNEAVLRSLHWRVTELELIALRSEGGASKALALQGAAVRAEINPSPVSRRADATAILEMGAFIRRLLDPDDLGFAVTQEVRQLARKALDLPKAPE